MKTIYLIRHCETTGQEDDAPLTNNGIKSSYKLADFLKNKGIEYIISSPYKRAIDSIKPFAEELNLEIETDNNLVEKKLSNINLDDWMQKLKDSFSNLDIKYKGGESSLKAINRAIITVNRVLETDYENIVIVTHGALMTLILKHFDKNIGFNEWKNLTNPDIYEIKIDTNNKVQMKRILMK